MIILLAFCCDFLLLFGVILATFGVPGPRGPSRDPFWQHGRKREETNSIFNRFGVPSGDPRGALWGTFSVLVATPRAQEPKKRRIARCLFAGSIFDRIFFTFRVPWIPKNKDSVLEGYTKPHFRPKPKKTRFYTDFVIVLRTIWTMLGTFGSPLGLESACFSFFAASIFLSFF